MFRLSAAITDYAGRKSAPLWSSVAEGVTNLGRLIGSPLDNGPAAAGCLGRFLVRGVFDVDASRIFPNFETASVTPQQDRTCLELGFLEIRANESLCRENPAIAVEETAPINRHRTDLRDNRNLGKWPNDRIEGSEKGETPVSGPPTRAKRPAQPRRAPSGKVSDGQNHALRCSDEPCEQNAMFSRTCDTSPSYH